MMLHCSTTIVNNRSLIKHRVEKEQLRLAKKGLLNDRSRVWLHFALEVIPEIMRGGEKGKYSSLLNCQGAYNT